MVNGLKPKQRHFTGFFYLLYNYYFFQLFKATSHSAAFFWVQNMQHTSGLPWMFRNSLFIINSRLHQGCIYSKKVFVLVTLHVAANLTLNRLNNN